MIVRDKQSVYDDLSFRDFRALLGSTLCTVSELKANHQSSINVAELDQEYVKQRVQINQKTV